MYIVNIGFPENLTDAANNERNLEYYIKLIAKELQECLNTNGISYDIVPSNSQSGQTVNLNFDIGNPENSANSMPTINLIFRSGNSESVRLANIVETNLKSIYSGEANINTVPEQSNTEIGNSQDIYLALEFEYGNNANIISWLMNNVEFMAKILVSSLCEYFGIPFIGCENYFMGMANFDATIFDKPSLNAKVIGNTTANSKVKVHGQWEDWYIVGENDKLGYVQTRFINI